MPKAAHAREAKRRTGSSGSASSPASSRATGSSADQHWAGKLRWYEILYTLNQGFEQVLYQLQQLENLGLGPWKALRVIVEENRAEINFELVERLAEREQSDWTYFGRLRQQREKKYRDPQDVLIEADRLRQRMKKPPTQRRGNRQP